MKLPLSITSIVGLACATLDTRKPDHQKTMDSHEKPSKISKLICTRPGPCLDGYQSNYSFNLGTEDHSRWMTGLPNFMLISNISIPGSHNSMAFGDNVRHALRTQNQNLSVQLSGGIRYFDIKATVVENKLLVTHGTQYLSTTFLDVLNTLATFLKANPQEVLIMHLQEDGKSSLLFLSFNPADEHMTSLNPLGEPTVNFKNVQELSTIEKFYKQYVWFPKNLGSDKDGFDPFWPALRDVRGKVLVLQGFGDQAESLYGIPWQSPRLDTQENYLVNNRKDMMRKSEAVYAGMRHAIQCTDRTAIEAPLNLFINYWNADTGLHPIEVAAGSREKGGSIRQGINQAGTFWLQKFNETKRASYQGMQRVGINILDFPGQKVVDQIIAMNNYK